MRRLLADFAVFFIVVPLGTSGGASADDSDLVGRALDMNDDEKAASLGQAHKKEPVLLF
ncbi:MAG TPA: hypothetical protein VNB89_08615 [Gemmatimonadaceae bacterium]|nr:hypothetical protein [Gemmatimonadaceae bacterium]